MTGQVDRYLVLVTGYAAAGKSTLAPKIADELGALWISRDTIHEMVYSGWEPQHPAVFQDTYDPHVGESTYLGKSSMESLPLDAETRHHQDPRRRRHPV